MSCRNPQVAQQISGLATPIRRMRTTSREDASCKTCALVEAEHNLSLFHNHSLQVLVGCSCLALSVWLESYQTRQLRQGWNADGKIESGRPTRSFNFFLGKFISSILAQLALASMMNNQKPFALGRAGKGYSQDPGGIVKCEIQGVCCLCLEKFLLKKCHAYAQWIHSSFWSKNIC